MADLCDECQFEIDNYIALAMRRKKKSSPALEANGFCHNCEEPVAENQLFCDLECRADMEKRERLKLLNP